MPICPAVTVPVAGLHYSRSGGAELQVCRKNERVSMSACLANPSPAGNYCTVNVTPCDCAIAPSVAVTVTLNVPRVVGVWIFTVAVPVLLGSATEVAVTVTNAGLGIGNAGAVYNPVGSTEPLVLPPVTAQATVWSAAATAAVNCWVCAGHPATVGHRFTVGFGATVTLAA